MTEVVIDCADHGQVVDFWAAALGYERREVNEQYVALVPPAREPGRPPLLFQKVPEPKVAKNRVHLDFRAPVMADEVARLVGLGATLIAERSPRRLRVDRARRPRGQRVLRLRRR